MAAGLAPNFAKTCGELGIRRCSARGNLHARQELLTKYMSAEHSKAGFLVITFNANRSWRHPDPDCQMPSTMLIDFLNAEARRLERELGGAVGLMARGRD